MSLQPKIIHIDDISCLQAKTEPLRIAVVQPRFDLVMTNEIGPHYHPTTIDNASKHIMEFLRIVKDTDCELSIAPEYYLPISVAKEILCNLDFFREDTFYILPMETQTYENFSKFITIIQNYNLWTLDVSEKEENGNNLSKKWVNAALMIYKKNEIKTVFIQFKTKPASPELNNMIEGKEIFAFEGENGVLSVAICSDVNHPLDKVWEDIAQRKPFNLTIHCQFNPKPDFEDYYQTFWSSILNTEGGDDRMIYSINWARGSSINTTSNLIVLNRQSTRFVRGKKIHKNYLYKDWSKLGLHLELRIENENSKKWWEIWHCILNFNNIRVIDFVRPKQGISDAQAIRHKTILSTQLYELKNDLEYVENEPEGLSAVFINQLNKYNSTSAGTLLNNLTPCEIEAFCAACNLSECEKWLEKEVDSRLPTAYLLCYNPSKGCNNGKPCKHIGKSCSKNRKSWEDETKYVASCLDRLQMMKNQKQHNFYPDLNNKYPNNFKDDEEKYGWIFHGKGFSSRIVGKKVSEILKKSKTKRRLAEIGLHRVDGEISLQDILDSPADDIANPDFSFQQDIFAKHQLPVIEIIQFYNQSGDSSD